MAPKFCFKYLDRKIDELGSEILTECNLISKKDFVFQYKVKFIHYNDGIEETRFNSGKSRFIDRNTGKEWTVFPDDAKLSLVDRFSKWLVDRREI